METTKKRIPIYVAVALALIVLIGSVVAVSMNREESLSVDELLSLGEKYLLDLDYEQALAQFLKVIEIELMNPRGYTGAAKAYIGVDDIDSAIAILEQGLELTGDASLTELLAGLNVNEAETGLEFGTEPTPESEAEFEAEAKTPTQQKPFSIEDLESWYYPPGLTIWDIQDELGLSTEDIEKAISETIQMQSNSFGTSHSSIDAGVFAAVGEDGQLVDLTMHHNTNLISEGPRGVKLGDSLESVFTKFMIDNQKAVDFIESNHKEEYDEGVIIIYDDGLEKWAQLNIFYPDPVDKPYTSLYYSIGNRSGNDPASRYSIYFAFDVDGILYSISVGYAY